MAGTIDFGLLGVGEPSGYEQARQRDVQGQLQNQQLESGRLSLEKMKQDRDALAKLQEVMAQHGQTGDFEQSLKAMVASGIPHAMDVGIKGLQKLQEQKQFAMLMGGGESAAAPAIAQAMPAQTAASAVEPTNALAAKYPNANTNSVMFNNNNLASDVVKANGGQSTNALAPAAVAAAPASNTADLDRRIAGFLGLGTPAAIAAAQDLQRQRAELTKPQIVGANSSIYIPGKGFVATAPATPEKAVKPLQELNAYKELSPADQKKFMEMKRAEQAPAQPVAPTITTIVDPNNPNQMITINAREYNGGSVGSQGVIGLAGKEPKAAAEEDKKVKGREDAQTLISQLRSSYNTLNESNAITSTKNKAGTNVGAAISSSGVGQFTGRVLGTSAQSERNTITQTRPLLLAAIKNATGMSAKQMDSNAEMQLYLKAATDPTLDYESNMKALNNLERMLTSGKLPTNPAAKPAGKPSGKPAGQSTASDPLGLRQ